MSELPTKRWQKPDEVSLREAVNEAVTYVCGARIHYSDEHEGSMPLGRKFHRNHSLIAVGLFELPHCGSCFALREERHRLPIQPRVSHHSAEASTARKVEAYDLVLRDTVERAVGTKPQTAGSAELGRAAG
jgi:hypothetical protein